MNNHYLKYKQLICVRIWEDLQARQVSKGEDWGKQACTLECHKQGYGNKTDKRVTSKRPSDCHGSATDLVQIAKEKKSLEENSGGNSQSTKGDSQEVPW